MAYTKTSYPAYQNDAQIACPNDAQIGPLSQLRSRLERIKESLAATRAHLASSVDLLVGPSGEQGEKNFGLNHTRDGLVPRFTDLCEEIQDEVSRLDVLTQRLGGLL